MTKQLLLFFSLSLGCTLAQAQPERAPVQTIDGKRYYVHTVQQGNTLYSIHRLYQIPVNALRSANPGVIGDRLALGQQILVPIAPIALGEGQQERSTHQVQKGETLYQISRRYNCAVNTLKQLNPGVEKGIRVGQIIQLPKATQEVTPPPVASNSDSTSKATDSQSAPFLLHTVSAKETLYRIAKKYNVPQDTIKALNDIKGHRIKKGTQLKIPVARADDQAPPPPKIGQSDTNALSAVDTVLAFPSKEEEYDVALLLPFLASKEVPKKKKASTETEPEIGPTTKIALEFYRGFLLATDSLKKAGLHLNLYVYDTERDTHTIAGVFRRPEFRKMDLVVGPIFPKTVAYAARKCKEKKIPIVLPFKTASPAVKRNDHVFRAVTENKRLLQEAADHVCAHHLEDNVVLLQPRSASDKELCASLRERLQTKLTAMGRAYDRHVTETGLGHSGGTALSRTIEKGATTIVLIPSTDVKFITEAFNRLNKVLNSAIHAKKTQIMVYGLEDWNKYNGIDLLHRNRLHQHYATYRYVDYHAPKGLAFVRTFRAAMKTDPTVYAIQGFDIGMYFLSALHLYGSPFRAVEQQYRMELIQNHFEFQSLTDNSSYDNHHTEIIRYRDFELVQCPK